MGDYFVRIGASSWKRLQDLQQVYHLDVFGPTAKQLADDAFEIDGLLSEDQVDQLRAAGYTVDVVADAGQVAADRWNEIASYRENQDGA